MASPQPAPCLSNGLAALSRLEPCKDVVRPVHYNASDDDECESMGTRSLDDRTTDLETGCDTLDCCLDLCRSEAEQELDSQHSQGASDKLSPDQHSPVPTLPLVNNVPTNENDAYVPIPGPVDSMETASSTDESTYILVPDNVIFVGDGQGDERSLVSNTLTCSATYTSKATTTLPKGKIEGDATLGGCAVLSPVLKKNLCIATTILTLFIGVLVTAGVARHSSREAKQVKPWESPTSIFPTPLPTTPTTVPTNSPTSSPVAKPETLSVLNQTLNPTSSRPSTVNATTDIMHGPQIGQNGTNTSSAMHPSGSPTKAPTMLTELEVVNTTVASSSSAAPSPAPSTSLTTMVPSEGKQLNTTTQPITALPVDAPQTFRSTLQPQSFAPIEAPSSLTPTQQPVTSEPTLRPETSEPTKQPVTAVPSTPPTSLAPTKVPTATATAPPSSSPISVSPTKGPVSSESRASTILQLLESVSIAAGSPEENALEWLINEDPAELDGSEPVRVHQRFALASLWFQQSAVANATWTRSNFWMTEKHECFWDGITLCDDTQQIQIIRMSSNRMVGKIPDSLGLLTNLRRVFLQDNALKGAIPPGLGRCTDLVVLQLGQNEFTGPIPESLSNLSKVRYVQLKENRLSGKLSPTLSSWTDLRIFSVSGNTLAGPIPTSFEAWSNLRKLQLFGNRFSGLIPAFPKWSQMEEYWIDVNAFAGSLPDNIGRDWPLLEKFSVARNRELNGPLPSSYSGWTNLTEFLVYQTGLTGPIPSEYGDLINMELFVVRDNSLSGTLPASLGQWRGLKEFSVSANLFHGTLPSSYANWVDLQEFWTLRNQLSGALPESFGAWTSLEKFVIAANQFEGAIPRSYAAWTNLKLFDVTNNLLSGNLPNDLLRWSNIQTALFQHNNFNETVVPFCGVELSGIREIRADCEMVECPCCSHCHSSGDS